MTNITLKFIDVEGTQEAVFVDNSPDTPSAGDIISLPYGRMRVQYLARTYTCMRKASAPVLNEDAKVVITIAVRGLRE